MEPREQAKFPCTAIAYRLDWEDGAFYVGSTTYKKLKTRIQRHRNNSRSEQPGKHLDRMRRLGVDSFTWSELGSKCVESRTAQCQFEQEYLDALKPTLNTYRAYLSPEQKKANDKAWRETNKEHLKSCNKAYRADPEHKAKAILISRNWHRDPENKDAIMKHRDTYRAQRQTAAGKSKIKAYNHKPEVKARNKAANKQRRAKAVADKLYACEACAVYAGTAADLRVHLKSKRHAQSV